MTTRSEFARALQEQPWSHLERAIALLWFYRQTQAYDDRTASELATDMSEEGFPRANVTRLRQGLLRSRFVVRAVRPDAFRVNLRYHDDFTQLYGALLSPDAPVVVDTVLPSEWVSGTRAYLENMIRQINGNYQYGFYDACVVLARRLMESLIIEVYIASGRAQEIRNQGAFLPLDRLISHICSDGSVSLSRNSPKTMVELKQLGDTAAHDRVYITHQLDLDEVRPRLRRLVQELLSLSGIRP
jgi:hypothetical protein